MFEGAGGYSKILCKRVPIMKGVEECCRMQHGTQRLVPQGVDECQRGQMALDASLPEDAGVERYRRVPVGVGPHSTVLCLRGAMRKGFKECLTVLKGILSEKADKEGSQRMLEGVDEYRRVSDGT